MDILYWSLTALMLAGLFALVMNDAEIRACLRFLRGVVALAIGIVTGYMFVAFALTVIAL